jgi:hypothetical protein
LNWAKKEWNAQIYSELKINNIFSGCAVPLAQVLPRPQLIFLSKTWFVEIYLNFQAVEITSKSISPTL